MNTLHILKNVDYKIDLIEIDDKTKTTNRTPNHLILKQYLYIPSQFSCGVEYVPRDNRVLMQANSLNTIYNYSNLVNVQSIPPSYSPIKLNGVLP